MKVAQNSDVRKQVTDEGGLEPVLYLARTDEPEIQVEVIPAICTLSFAEENKVDIAKNGGLPPVIAAIRDANVETARMACCALANLCEVVENTALIMDHNPVPALMEVLVGHAPLVQCEAARAMGNLAANIEYGDEILRAGAQRYLMIMLRSEEERCQRMAAMALCNLASNLQNQPKMIAAGILEPVVGEAHLALDAKSKSDFECVRYCLLVLANLAVCQARDRRPAKSRGDRPRAAIARGSSERAPEGLVSSSSTGRAPELVRCHKELVSRDAGEPPGARGGSVTDARGVWEASRREM